MTTCLISAAPPPSPPPPLRSSPLPSPLPPSLPTLLASGTGIDFLIRPSQGTTVDMDGIQEASCPLLHVPMTAVAVLIGAPLNMTSVRVGSTASVTEMCCVPCLANGECGGFVLTDGMCFFKDHSGSFLPPQTDFGNSTFYRALVPSPPPAPPDPSSLTCYPECDDDDSGDPSPVTVAGKAPGGRASRGASSRALGTEIHCVNTTTKNVIDSSFCTPPPPPPPPAPSPPPPSSPPSHPPPPPPPSPSPPPPAPPSPDPPTVEDTMPTGTIVIVGAVVVIIFSFVWVVYLLRDTERASGVVLVLGALGGFIASLRGNRSDRERVVIVQAAVPYPSMPKGALPLGDPREERPYGRS